MSDVVVANDTWVLATLGVDPVVLRTLPNGGAIEEEPEQPIVFAPKAQVGGSVAGSVDVTPQGTVFTDFNPGTGTSGSSFSSDSGTGLQFAEGFAGRAGTGSGSAFPPFNPRGNESGNALSTADNQGTGANVLSTADNQGTGENAILVDSLLGGTGTGTGTGTVFDELPPFGGGTGTGTGTGTGFDSTGSGSATMMSTWDSGSGPSIPIVAGNVGRTPEQLKQAMLDKMPLTTKRPEWAKSIDMGKAVLGREIKSGSFGTASWVDGVGGESLVIKTGKLGPDENKVLANCSDLAHEAEVYEKIGEHPNIAKCMGIQEVDGQRGLVLEGIRGKDMHGTMDRLEKLRKGDRTEMAKLGLTKPLSQSDFVGMQQYMIGETLKGLAQLESVGVVHGDIRPDNIMVDGKTGGVKLVDLGIAFNAGERPKISPIGHGSVGPELTRPGGMQPSFDVFSAGEIAHKGFEGDQFRYGAKGDIAMSDFKKFGELGPDGAPLNQVLSPQTGPVKTLPDDDFKGRLDQARDMVWSARNDKFVVGETVGDNSVISGDTSVDKQLADSLKICDDLYKQYRTVKGTGDILEVQTAEALGKAMTELERRVAQAKTTGSYGAETEYTKFVSWAMNPDPTKRPSANEALKHPFLADSLLDGEAARSLMMKLLADTQQPP